jgi:hypothetical protein
MMRTYDASAELSQPSQTLTATWSVAKHNGMLVLCAACQVQLSLTVACNLSAQLNQMSRFENEVAFAKLIWDAGFPERKVYKRKAYPSPYFVWRQRFSK